MGAWRKYPAPSIYIFVRNAEGDNWGYSGFCRRGGARVFVFDVLFTEQSNVGPDDDLMLADAITHGPPTALALFLGTTTEQTDAWPEAIPLAAEIYPPLRGQGYELWTHDGLQIGPLEDLELHVNDDPTGTLEGVTASHGDELRMVGVFNNRVDNSISCVWEGRALLDGSFQAEQDLLVRRGYTWRRLPDPR